MRIRNWPLILQKHRCPSNLQLLQTKRNLNPPKTKPSLKLEKVSSTLPLSRLATLSCQKTHGLSCSLITKMTRLTRNLNNWFKLILKPEIGTNLILQQQPLKLLSSKTCTNLNWMLRISTKCKESSQKASLRALSLLIEQQVIIVPVHLSNPVRNFNIM